ncbi:hypothetical protein POX_g08673 [Penicillium oxalicum]|uniref:hypothetical protein n=1 Tax=Penicillium oxalicum TaxID=69781 RepID=UPI0020B7FFEF|nr:hypothetical protein POX_g08673 [Penicillium oxalicum]KAI2786290.1 hypothetical protein POX_g08673 [Penicillium oxalicum]
MATPVDSKLLKRTKFPPEFNRKVDMTKVNIEVMKKWIAKRISDILGNEDDVVIELCFNLLEGTRFPDIKSLQIQLTGFLDKDTPKFCKELWSLCLSGQENPQGVPKELLEAKKQELMQEKLEAERAAEAARREREEERIRERELNDMRRRERSDRGERGDRGWRRGHHDRRRSRSPAGQYSRQRYRDSPRRMSTRPDRTPPPGRSDSRSPRRSRRPDFTPPRARSPSRSPRRSRRPDVTPPDARHSSRSPRRPRRPDVTPPRARSPSRSPRRSHRPDITPPDARSSSRSPRRFRRPTRSPSHGRGSSPSPRRYRRRSFSRSSSPDHNDRAGRRRSSRSSTRNRRD